MPDDQSFSQAQISAAARSMRELYVALTKEGFTPEQALELVKAILPRQA